jgi:anti-sigma factor RsiW
MKGERTVGGLRCSEVLEGLSAYLDGELAAAQRAAVEAHVRGCELCARFGGAFSAAITGLRSQLADADDVPDEVARRLAESLRRAK